MTNEQLRRQRNAWRAVALEQAQTIQTLRRLLIARGPRPAHSYRDEAYAAARGGSLHDEAVALIAAYEETAPRKMRLGDLYSYKTHGWHQYDWPALPTDWWGWS